MKNSKRGAAMVEAAIVLPLVIAAVMAVIYILINLYSFTALRASLHIQLRAEASETTGLTEIELDDGRVHDKYRRAAERRGVSVEAHKALRPYVSAELAKTFSGNALVSVDVSRRAYGRYYVTDEIRNVRIAGFLGAKRG
jgi:hypothetical protein